MHGAQIPDPGDVPTFDPARQRPVMPSAMELVINALDIPISFEIGGFPGSPAMRFDLPPNGQAYLPKTYCVPIEGATPHIKRPSVLAMVASVEPWPGGPQIQGVVPLADYKRTRKAWLEAKASAPKTSIVMLQDREGNAVSLAVPKAAPAPARRVDPDDEDDAIEPPPPGVDDIRQPQSAAEPAPAAKPPKPPKPPKGGAAARVVNDDQGEG